MPDMTAVRLVSSDWRKAPEKRQLDWSDLTMVGRHVADFATGTRKGSTVLAICTRSEHLRASLRSHDYRRFVVVDGGVISEGTDAPVYSWA